MTAPQPMSYPVYRLTEKGMSQLGRVQAARPAAGRGRIRQSVRVLKLRQRLLPRAVLHKAPPQRLAARQQAVMRIGKRKQRKESEGRPTTGAAAAMDPNPVVMLVVGLLATPSVTNDRIPLTNRASA